jgi:AhpD family alkylhydroperoxidase
MLPLERGGDPRVRDDLGRAARPEPGDPALAEWLEEASCGPSVKALAVLAADAAMAELERAVHGSALEPGLLELVRVRASQVNGCTYCLAMHNRDARAQGEHQTRLDTVAAWREAPYYTPRERAALAWCEALTELPRAGAPDDVHAAVEAVFSPAEIAALTFAIVAINGWNRLAVGLRSDVLSLDGLDLPAGATAPAAASGSA